jgi:hypothetical protein
MYFDRGNSGLFTAFCMPQEPPTTGVPVDVAGFFKDEALDIAAGLGFTGAAL